MRLVRFGDIHMHTRLDRLMNGRPVGSPAVRAFIETHRPQVASSGHIHEGRGIDRIG